MTTLKKRRTSKLSDLEVTVYTTPGCTGCPKTLRILRDHHIPHTIIDLSTDKAAYQYVTQNLQYRQAPIVKVHNGWEQATWSGHRPELIAEFILQFYNPMKQVPAQDADDNELYAAIGDTSSMDQAHANTTAAMRNSGLGRRTTGPHLHFTAEHGPELKNNGGGEPA